MIRAMIGDDRLSLLDRLFIAAAFLATFAVIAGCTPSPRPYWEPVRHDDSPNVPPGNDGGWHFTPPGSR